MGVRLSDPVRLFIFGLGYSASAFAHAFRAKADWIGGTVREPDKAASLASDGLHTFVFDGENPGAGVAEALRDATHVLVSIAPGTADPVLAVHGGTIRDAPHLRWIGYLSTVGVYGDHGGDWVDEATAPRPVSRRSRERVVAEEAWSALAAECGVPLAIFRLAGIYGPGRNAFVNLAGGRAKRIVKPGQVFNRIHVDDIAQVLAAAVTLNASGVFNVADEEPAPPQDVVAYAAGLMGVDPPPEVPFDDADMTPMARSFYGENKRVSNRRLKNDLGVVLRYPTWREALTALWQDGNWRG